LRSRTTSQMQSASRIVLASAGSGKTTLIVEDACNAPDYRSALLTYTINNAAVLRSRVFDCKGFVPPNVTVSTWYTFLLRHFIRPYQRCLYPVRVSRICFVPGASTRGIRADNIRAYFFAQPGHIYSDKISDFACRLILKTNGLPITRCRQIFDSLYIDESQDLAGYDLDLLERLMESGFSVTLVGDHRQATYSTHNARKNKQYSRAGVIDKFREWQKRGICSLRYEYRSHRCVQAICDFADALFPGLPRTTSLNSKVTGHDGVFALPASRVAEYIAAFRPQTLRYSRKSIGIPGDPLNFGASKGMTFERTLIFPHGPLGRFLMSGNLSDAGKELCKIYVAVTRARQSVAFVVPDGVAPACLRIFDPAATP
jgi:DNA helicase II / ATP-dependent DNA helicase PcrA